MSTSIQRAVTTELSIPFKAADAAIKNFAESWSSWTSDFQNDVEGTLEAFRKMVRGDIGNTIAMLNEYQEEVSLQLDGLTLEELAASHFDTLLPKLGNVGCVFRPELAGYACYDAVVVLIPRWFDWYDEIQQRDQPTLAQFRVVFERDIRDLSKLLQHYEETLGDRASSFCRIAAG